MRTLRSRITTTTSREFRNMDFASRPAREKALAFYRGIGSLSRRAVQPARGAADVEEDLDLHGDGEGHARGEHAHHPVRGGAGADDGPAAAGETGRVALHHGHEVDDLREV